MDGWREGGRELWVGWLEEEEEEEDDDSAGRSKLRT